MLPLFLNQSLIFVDVVFNQFSIRILQTFFFKSLYFYLISVVMKSKPLFFPPKWRITSHCLTWFNSNQRNLPMTLRGLGTFGRIHPSLLTGQFNITWLYQAMHYGLEARLHSHCVGYSTVFIPECIARYSQVTWNPPPHRTSCLCLDTA